MKKNKVYIGVIALSIFLVVIIPAIVNCLFKIDAKSYFFIAEWSAGDFLGYYGDILSFVSTSVLSALALWQNEIIKKESDKHTSLLEEMELQKSQPFFKVQYISSEVEYSKTKIGLYNISPNIALDISMIELIVKKNNEVVQKQIDVRYGDLMPDKELRIELNNGRLNNGSELCIKIKCKDIYGNINYYMIESEKVYLTESNIVFWIKKVR